MLIFVYQMLSAMGSQVLDFLVFDRAAARYDDAAELTRFVALYTGVLNAVDLVFLAVLAAWLLLRFGLRLGLVANPAAVTALTIAMLIAVLGPGPSSLALFAIVVTARIVDIALSDGMTRGSINAVFQVLPVEERMAVQASVEGIGVPVAIGATGVMLLVMNALDLGTSVVVAFAVVLCALWTVAAIVGYGDYRRALAARLRRRGLDVQSALPVGVEEQTAARRLLLTDDVSDIRLGLDLAVTANLTAADLADLARHGDRDIRLLALGQLARRGDDAAATEAIAIARLLAGSSEVLERRAAALALADVHPPDREAMLRGLLTDGDVTVRVAALGSVGAGDDGVGDVVLAALEEPATVEAAIDAARRLGAVALELAAARLLGARCGLTSPAALGGHGRRPAGGGGRDPRAARRPPEPPRLGRRVDGVGAPGCGRRGDRPRRAPGRRRRALCPRARRRLLDDARRRRACGTPSTTCSPSWPTGRWPCSRCATARHGSPPPVARSPAPTGRAAPSAWRCCSCRSRGPRSRSSNPSCAATSTRATASGCCAPARTCRSETARVGSPTSRSTRPGGGDSPWLQAVALHAELVSAPAVAAGHARDIASTQPSPPDGAQPALDELVLVASGSAGTRPADPSSPAAGG